MYTAGLQHVSAVTRGNSHTPMFEVRDMSHELLTYTHLLSARSPGLELILFRGTRRNVCLSMSDCLSNLYYYERVT